MISDPREQFGEIDIYLFDQLLRGRIRPGMTIFDAGCGSGRNIAYFLRSGFDVFGIDNDPAAVDAIRKLAETLAPALAPENFRHEAIESHSFPDESADLVICNAVLHFARDETHFGAMVRGAWRVLRKGGVLFSRLASTVGLEGRVVEVGGGRFRLPDGTERFLATEELLKRTQQALDAEQLDPLKTTLVEHVRSMTTWVLGKAR